MKLETNNIIEKFILGELNDKELDDFMHKLEKSNDFANEVNINQGIANSLLEQDVMDLRSNLQVICSNSQTKQSENALFDLAQNLSRVSVENEFSSDISTTKNSLQYIHVENHLKSFSERIHQISIKTDIAQETVLSKQIYDFVFEEEIKDAILEKDIGALRDNLKEIVSHGYISFSDYEIDQYCSNDLSQNQVKEIDELYITNIMMADQIKLHKEIDCAVKENDIISFRNSLAEIIEDEQQISYAEINRIDEYLLEYLDEKEHSEFEYLLEENSKLKKETILNSEINEAITEADVIRLRFAISEIIEETKPSTKIRKFIPANFQNKPMRYIGVAASAAAVISAGLFTLTQQKTTSETLFQQAYHPYDATGLFRSAPLSNPSFKGIELYNERKFDNAIDQFGIVLKENSEHPMCNFYTGLCYLEKNQFDNAICSFQKVIEEKDNLFTEQAEWYMALGLLKTNEVKKSYALLNRIEKNNGYYKKNAKELLKKLK